MLERDGEHVLAVGVLVAAHLKPRKSGPTSSLAII
jgi:hypothetical protein